MIAPRLNYWCFRPFWNGRKSATGRHSSAAPVTHLSLEMGFFVTRMVSRTNLATCAVIQGALPGRQKYMDPMILNIPPKKMNTDLTETCHTVPLCSSAIFEEAFFGTGMGDGQKSSSRPGTSMNQRGGCVLIFAWWLTTKIAERFGLLKNQIHVFVA